jgi:AcrR family transcriptional regulator
MSAAEVRRERGRREMRDQILAAARAILAEEGVSALSMRAVARRIGYAPASLYEYFASKEAVCKALFFEGAEGLAGRMRQALDALPADAPAAERLGALGRAYRAQAVAQAELYQLAFGAVTLNFTPTQADLDTGREGYDLLVEVCRRGVERGEFLAMDPAAIAVACWAGVHGFVMLEINHLLGGNPHCPPGEIDRAALDPLFEATLHVLGYGFVRRAEG